MYWFSTPFGPPDGRTRTLSKNLQKKILKNEHRASTRVKNVISNEAILAKKWSESTKKYFGKKCLQIRKAAGPLDLGPPF